MAAALTDRMDLPKANVREFGVTVFYPRGSEAVSVISDLASVEDIDSSWAGVQGLIYSRSKKKHSYVEFAITAPEEAVGDVTENYLAVRFIYSIESSPGSPDRINKQSYLSALSRISPTRVRASCSFEFTEDESSGSFFKLPLVYDESGFLDPEWPVDEIIGIRGRKRATGKEEQTSELDEYTFILEQPNHHTRLTIDLVRSDPVEVGALARLFDECVSISIDMGFNGQLKKAKSRRVGA